MSLCSWRYSIIWTAAGVHLLSNLVNQIVHFLKKCWPH